MSTFEENTVNPVNPVNTMVRSHELCAAFTVQEIEAYIIRMADIIKGETTCASVFIRKEWVSAIQALSIYIGNRRVNHDTLASMVVVCYSNETLAELIERKQKYVVDMELSRAATGANTAAIDSIIGVATVFIDAANSAIMRRTKKP